MLSRSRRLTTRQFDQVMEKGVIFHSPFFLARIAAFFGKSRVAAVAPIKAFKTAVSRTSLRRRTYAALRPLLPSLTDGFAVILFAKPPAKDASVAEIQEGLKQLFVKARILR